MIDSYYTHVEAVRRILGGGGDDDHGDGEHQGFHIEFTDLYFTILYLVCTYVMGQLASRVLRMPSLVGEIFCGILLGPPLANIVPNAVALVLLGEIGLILLVIEAGIDIDVTVMKLVGTRGLMIAIVGSFLPIAVGIGIASALQVGDFKAILAAGCVFGPTSLGIALNVLKGGGMLNTPVGQMIVAAAVVDDMIALVILSQLKALVGEITVASIVIPIVSALAFLVLGGYVAVFVLPKLLRKYLLPRFKESVHNKVEMACMFALVLVLMPATYYAQASYLMGSFLAGLVFCTSDGLHHLFVRQFKRVLQWLMRVFFSSTIGFQVPIKDFGDATVIWQGLVFCLSWLIGKVAVGFMVPNFSQHRRFTGNHFRDCVVTGFSMAAEGEFAFVIAVFAYDGGLINKDLYATLILSVLISTIVPPFCLRFTISHYNKLGEAAVQALAAEEDAKRMLGGGKDIESNDSTVEDPTHNDMYLVLQTQSDSKWGLLIKIMDVMGQKGLDVIDHRAWSPRGVNTTLINEVYARCTVEIGNNETAEEALENLIEDVTTAIRNVIDQPDAKVKVQRWFPGVVEQVVEDTDGAKTKTTKNLRQMLLKEASTILERKSSLQMNATRAKSVKKIFSGDIDDDEEVGGGDIEVRATQEHIETGLSEKEESNVPSEQPAEQSGPRRRKKPQRLKTISTPVVGGGLFGEVSARSGREEGIARVNEFKQQRKQDDDLDFTVNGAADTVPAEITIEGEIFRIRLSKDTHAGLKKSGMDGHQRTDSRGVPIRGISIRGMDDVPVVHRLHGFVRNAALHRIHEGEEHDDHEQQEEDKSQIDHDSKASNATSLKSIN